MLVDSKEKRYLKNFYDIMEKTDGSYFDPLEELILIHKDSPTLDENDGKRLVNMPAERCPSFSY